MALFTICSACGEAHREGQSYDHKRTFRFEDEGAAQPPPPLTLAEVTARLAALLGEASHYGAKHEEEVCNGGCGTSYYRLEGMAPALARAVLVALLAMEEVWKQVSPLSMQPRDLPSRAINEALRILSDALGERHDGN